MSMLFAKLFFAEKLIKKHRKDISALERENKKIKKSLKDLSRYTESIESQKENYKQLAGDLVVQNAILERKLQDALKNNPY